MQVPQGQLDIIEFHPDWSLDDSLAVLARQAEFGTPTSDTILSPQALYATGLMIDTALRGSTDEGERNELVVELAHANDLAKDLFDTPGYSFLLPPRGQAPIERSQLKAYDERFNIDSTDLKTTDKLFTLIDDFNQHAKDKARNPIPIIINGSVIDATEVAPHLDRMLGEYSLTPEERQNIMNLVHGVAAELTKPWEPVYEFERQLQTEAVNRKQTI